MKRLLLAIAAILSLAVCFATVWSWIADNQTRGQHVLFLWHGQQNYQLTANSGSFRFLSINPTPIAPSLLPSTTLPRGRVRVPVYSGRELLTIPHWPIALISAALAAFFIARLQHHKKIAQRIKTNHCPTCGYDLRASPDCCPECGTSKQHQLA